MQPYKIVLTLVRPTILFFMSASACVVFGQAPSFTYQGRLQDGGTNANGSYDFQFTLWDAASGGTQQPQPNPVTVTRTSVAVANGTFTVQLDFGSSGFPGADRFLEIRVRPGGGSGFTILEPRQPITATPYAVRSASAASADTATTATSAASATNSSQLGGVAANNYVQTNDSRLSDFRPPTSGSSNYIQNTTSPQASSNFNISGNGTIGGNLITNGRVGIGRSTPGAKLDALADAGTGVLGESGSGFGVHGASNSGIGLRGVANSGIAVYGSSAGLAAQFDGRVYLNGDLGIGVSSPTSKLQVNGQARFSTVNIDSYVSGQNLNLCTTNTGGNQNIVGLCSSSLRYKMNVQSFRKGLDVIRRLEPISFDWKDAGTHDVGLAAEDVERVDPLFTFRNDKGEIEGVKYNQLSALFINTFKEQQAQIESQQEQLKQQQEQIKRQGDQARQQRAAFASQQQQLDALKRLVCRSNRRAAVCK